MGSPGRALQSYLEVHAKETRQPTRFAIKHAEKSLYIHSDVDSSGMSIVLASRSEQTDSWDNEDEASAFMRRCVERYPETPLLVVPV